ncbi:MAG: hypothetical protein GX590_03445 [Lentisphaerae bacterium]|nr:hypothetical protein [Lentisphaerota bacterium]
MNESAASPTLTPDLQASLLCDDVRQERNGKFILIGIFEGLIVPAFPAVFHRLCLVNRWCCGEGEFHQITRMVSNDGATRIIEGGPVPVRLKDVNQVVTSVEYFVNLKIPGPGAYWIEILLDQQLKLRYPLHVRKQHEPA